MTYADAELLAVTWLTPRLGVRVVTDTPAEMAKALPLVQVTRYGGADGQPTLDRVQLDVDCYTDNRRTALQLAEQVRDALRFDLPGTTVDGALVCAVDTIGAPAWRPFDVTGVRRFGASYRLIIQKG